MLALWIALAGAQTLAVRGDRVHPVSGPVIEQGVVLIEAGRITAVGPAATLPVPEGIEVVEGAVVTPGLVDGLTAAGLTGIYNSRADQDHREASRPLQPQLRAIDAYNPWEDLVGWLRVHGVTTVVAGPSPGNVIGGRALVASTIAAAPEEAVRVADGAMVFSLGEGPKRVVGQQSRMAAAASIRQALVEAREYGERRRLPLADRPTIDLGKEALLEVLAGERQAIFAAHRADDLLTAVRIRDEFGLDLVLAGATEGYLVADVLAGAEVPVLVGPVMARSWSPDGELSNMSFENAAILAEAGVPLGFTGGFEGYVPKVRVVLWEAAVAAANGLGAERALHALTLGGATAVGVEDEVGSLQVGKRADLVVFDGDPFEYTSHVCAVVIEGAVVSQSCH